MKFRKKPVVVEAEQFDESSVDRASMQARGPLPEGVCLCLVELWPTPEKHVHAPHVHTVEGPHIVSPGDWIITGIKGEKYPCKPDIFAATYEAVDG